MDNNKEAKTEFAKIIYGLAENFSSTVTDNGLQMRFEALKSFKLSQIKESAMIILRTRKYTTMPTVADFIEAIEGNSGDMADIQKSIVMEAINCYQPNQKFKDPITQDIINKIGWHKIGQVNKKEHPFILKEFKEMYQTYKKVSDGNLLNAPDDLKRIADNSTKRIL